MLLPSKPRHAGGSGGGSRSGNEGVEVNASPLTRTLRVREVIQIHVIWSCTTTQETHTCKRTQTLTSSFRAKGNYGAGAKLLERERSATVPTIGKQESPRESPRRARSATTVDTVPSSSDANVPGSVAQPPQLCLWSACRLTQSSCGSAEDTRAEVEEEQIVSLLRCACVCAYVTFSCKCLS